MTSQLSLISLPASTADPSVTPADPTASPVDRSGERSTDRGGARPGVSVRPVRRSAGHSGWLDSSTISSGRRGVAAARAALAAATERVARRESDAELDRQRDLVRLAGDRHAA